MTGHVDAWLMAYYDGELGGRRRREVEAHLAECEACRAQLDELAGLSALLMNAPEPADLTPPDRFVAQVQLQLPRQPVEAGCRPRVVELGWNLAPLGLFAVWAFLQAVAIVSEVVEVALEQGWGGEALRSVLSASVTTPEWVAEISAANRNAFQVLAGMPLEGLLPLNLWITGLMSVLAGVWLALWLLRQRRMAENE